MSVQVLASKTFSCFIQRNEEEMKKEALIIHRLLYGHLYNSGLLAIRENHEKRELKND